MNKNILAMVVIGIICLGVGGLVGYMFTPGSSTLAPSSGLGPNGQYQNTFSDGWRAAKEYLKTSGFIPVTETVKSLSGVVKQVDGSAVIISTALLNPLDDEKLKERRVVISSDTTILVRRPMTAAEMEQAEKERQDKISDLKKEIAKTTDENKKIQLAADLLALQNVVAMDNMKSETIALKDLQAGQFVMVEAAEDIAEKVEFTAIKVSLQGNDLAGGAIAPAPVPNANDSSAPSGPVDIPGPGI